MSSVAQTQHVCFRKDQSASLRLSKILDNSKDGRRTWQFNSSTAHSNVTHEKEVASKIALKMELSIFITDCIKTQGLKQSEAAVRLNVTQSRVSELTTGKIEKFTIDAMMDMLDKLGFRTTFTLPSNDVGATPQIVISHARDR